MDLRRVAWYYDGKSGSQSHVVGQKEPNAWGLHDVLGNVCEWVEDDWHSSYQGAPDDGSAWLDEPRVDLRVLRSGGFDDGDGDVRACRRQSFHPGSRSDGGVGFRVAVSPFSS